MTSTEKGLTYFFITEEERTDFDQTRNFVFNADVDGLIVDRKRMSVDAGDLEHMHMVYGGFDRFITHWRFVEGEIAKAYQRRGFLTMIDRLPKHVYAIAIDNVYEQQIYRDVLECAREAFDIKSHNPDVDVVIIPLLESEVHWRMGLDANETVRNLSDPKMKDALAEATFGLDRTERP